MMSFVNGSEVDEEPAAWPTATDLRPLNGSVVPCSSRSSSTLSGDDGRCTSFLNRIPSNSIVIQDDTDSSSGHDLDSSTVHSVPLRPLYSASRDEDVQEVPRAQDLRLSQRSRKGHRKSRQGCFNCKRRKIKCQETLPACENCLRKDLQCKYPLVKAPSLLQACSSDNSLMNIQLQTTPIFSLVDMHLFHHFLTNAYPHLPVGNDSVWVHRVPAVAHHYEYLMHALLGMAASHLTVTTGADYSSIALSHRFLAIKGFNEALSKMPRSGSDGDALLAACYALTFQSSYMKDGMSEFLTMVRGCGLVSYQLLADNVDVSFSITPNRHLAYMESRLDNLPYPDADLLEGSSESFKAMLPLCENGDAHMIFHNALQDCLETIAVDPRKGYYKFIRIYQVLGQMTNQQYQTFQNPTNETSQLLLAHFVAIEIMIAPILGREWKGRIMSAPMESVLLWLSSIQDSISESYRGYLAWPEAVAAIVKAELRGHLPARPWLTLFFKRTAGS